MSVVESGKTGSNKPAANTLARSMADSRSRLAAMRTMDCRRRIAALVRYETG
jgi:hypothetical protein